MIHCISVENMRLSDAYTIANFVPGHELMHRAALGVFRAVDWSGKIGIVVGSGNNGGDGYALACILQAHGYDCTVFTVSTKLSPDSALYAQKAVAAGVSILPVGTQNLKGFSILVDCLLGTGFQGSVRADYRKAIEDINASGAYVVSVDINSGMNGDTGEAEIAVRSDLTVTIGYVKNGLITPGAGKYMKRLVCADIGIRLIKEENKILSPGEWQEWSNSLQENSAENRYFPCPGWLEMEPVTESK